jgi:hypothetical protein
LLWLLVKFNQTYTTTIYYPAQVKALPLEVAPDEFGLRSIGVNCEGLGSRLFTAWLRRNRDTVRIEYDPKRRGNPWVVLGADQSAFLRTKLPTGVRMINFEPDSIRLLFETRTNKRVPLRIDNSFAPPFGYRVDSTAIRGLDSVRITGPAAMLDTIYSWQTLEQRIAVTAEPKSYAVLLDSLEGIEVSPSQVQIYVRPSRYIEVKINVELFCPDAPKGMEVKFFPPRIELLCSTPLLYRREAPSALRLEVPYSSLDPTRGLLYPEPTMELPPGIELIVWEPTSVSFIVQDMGE